MNKITISLISVIAFAVVAAFVTLWYGMMIFAPVAAAIIVSMFLVVWVADLLC